ncbi:MAG: cation transporter [Phyllobacteriaceae bacterium]|nr:cation transporter [Phyllobacteriaceae bacterium]
MVRRLALGSIAVAFAVMALKFVAWRLTGSVALYSDALESIVNVVAAFAAFMAIRWAQQPADADHPFGHHKAELLSAVAEGVLIVIAALLIFHQAATTILNPHTIEQAGEGIAVNFVASAINGAWAFLLIRVGRRERSPALVADGKHVMSDVVTSAGVLVGLVLALATGWLILDPLLAAVVAVNILWQGWLVINESIQGLMDTALSDSEQAEVRRLIEANATGALEYHDLKSRGAGAARFVEFHLIVPAAMSVFSSHEICDRIEKAIKAGMDGMTVVIHVEPEHKRKAGGVALSAP